MTWHEEYATCQKNVAEARRAYSPRATGGGGATGGGSTACMNASTSASEPKSVAWQVWKND